MTDTLAPLVAVTETAYARQQQAFAALLAEEARLRAEIVRLDGMRHAAASDSGTAPMQAIGADVLWQGWIARAKTALNLELARTLARKEPHQAAVRRAYGKVLVARQLQDDARRAARNGAARHALDAAISGSIDNLQR